MPLPDLTHLATPGTRIEIRVTPGAARNRITDEGGLRIYVTTPPEGGKANAAVQKLLAKAIGLPKSRLDLIQGSRGRDKVFMVK